MHIVKFNYINPQIHSTAKNFSTSEVSTNPTKPVTFRYMNSLKKQSNRTIRAKNIPFITDRRKTEVEVLVSRPSFEVRPWRCSQEQQQQRILKSQIQEFRKQLQQNNKQFTDLVKYRAQTCIKYNDSLHKAALTQMELNNNIHAREQELKQLRDLFHSIELDFLS